MKKEGTVFPFPLFVFFRERHDVFPFAENKKNLTSEEVRFCRVSTEKMHSFRIHLNQLIGDMPALCYEYPVKVLPHPFFW